MTYKTVLWLLFFYIEWFAPYISCQIKSSPKEPCTDGLDLNSSRNGKESSLRRKSMPSIREGREKIMEGIYLKGRRASLPDNKSHNTAILYASRVAKRSAKYDFNRIELEAQSMKVGVFLLESMQYNAVTTDTPGKSTKRSPSKGHGLSRPGEKNAAP
jgi:hypothetical protein